jgi:hypothetical protein
MLWVKAWMTVNVVWTSWKTDIALVGNRSPDHSALSKFEYIYIYIYIGTIHSGNAEKGELLVLEPKFSETHVWLILILLILFLKKAGERT